MNRWPSCKVISIEADPANFHLLVRNVASYGDRVIPVLAAVLERNGHATLHRNPERGHWSTQVDLEPEKVGAVTIPAITFSDICGWTSGGKVDFVKMDIEGAESSVLRWLMKHPVVLKGADLAVELHNGDARSAFNELASQRGGPVASSGEYSLLKL